MSQQPLSNRILAGAFTFVGLGLVWIAIVSNLSPRQELSANELTTSRPVPATAAPEPVLDLSIPGVPPASSEPRGAALTELPPVAGPADARSAQVARLRCDAEVERLCPEAPDGNRRQCLERRAAQLPLACQQQVRERLVRWKEDRNRLVLACQSDIRRFCDDVKLGGGQQLQCLQQHAQDLSDACYQMLPKGTLYFKH